MRNLARAFMCDERGTTMIEYVIIASLISAAIIAIVTSIGSEVAALFAGVSAGL